MSQRWFVFALGLSLAVMICCTNVSFAQGPGGGRGGPGGGFFGGGGDNTLGLLRDENVKKELDIVDSQDQKITALSDKMREDMRSMFSGMREASEEDRQKMMEAAQAKMKTRMEELRKELDTILLPQQKDRLKQIALQSRMRFQSTSQALASDDAAAALKLTDEQKEKLAAMQKDADDQLRKEIEQLRKKMSDKVLSVLTPEQQAQWKTMVGNPIEFAPQQFGRGGPGGGRGGPGGGGNPNSN